MATACAVSWLKLGQMRAIKTFGMHCKQVASMRSKLLSATLMLFTAFCVNAVEMPKGIASYWLFHSEKLPL